MREDRTDRRAPPDIPTNALDAERMRFLERAAAWLQKRHRHITPVIMTGGTALSMSYHRARGTGDLDIDTAQRLDVEESIKKMLKRGGDAERFLISTKQDGRGFTRVEHLDAEGNVQWRTKIDQRVRAREDMQEYTHRPGPTGTPLDTYSLRQLALIKIKKMQTRDEGRDLFDHAYVVATWPDLYTKDERREAVELLREATEENEEFWRKRLKEDRGTRRGDVDEIMTRAWMVAMNDPATVIDEMEAPELVILQVGERNEYDVEIRSATTSAHAVIAESLTATQTEAFISNYRLNKEGIGRTVERCPDAEKAQTRCGAALAEHLRRSPTSKLDIEKSRGGVTVKAVGKDGTVTVLGEVESAKEIVTEQCRIGQIEQRDAVRHLRRLKGKLSKKSGRGRTMS